MNVRETKQMAQHWVELNHGQWPGLRAAHLVGGITTMADDAPFPGHKDVDMHLVFDDDSPILRADGPFPTIMEVEYQGLLIEAGLKPLGEYRSAEAVLANPEIAHHLTLDSVLYDPSDLLRELQEPVRRGFARRQWVLARVDHERNGLQGALDMLPMARSMGGAGGELNILGYSTTFIGAALAVAALKPPRIGSRHFLHVRESLANHDRLDLYDEILAILGLAGATPERAERFLHEATEAFDLAVEVRRAPHPFQHKLHRHLRPYFVDACQSMLDEGHHREALGWITPYFIATSDVIAADGPADEQPRFARRYARFLADLGFDTAEKRAAKWERAHWMYQRCFALADDIIARHPAIEG